MTNFVVVLLTNLAPTEHSRPHIVRTVLPTANVNDAQDLVRRILADSIGFNSQQVSNGWRRQAEVCVRLHWAGGTVLVPTDQLPYLGQAVQDARQDLDETVEVSAAIEGHKKRFWQGEDERKAILKEKFDPSHALENPFD